MAIRSHFNRNASGAYTPEPPVPSPGPADILVNHLHTEMHSPT